MEGGLPKVEKGMLPKVVKRGERTSGRERGRGREREGDGEGSVFQGH